MSTGESTTEAGSTDGEGLHSIGDLAAATGIAAETIRAWERRYGRPRGIRLPSGHRRYTDGDVRWLRRAAEALAHGHRPSHVARLDEGSLDRLLEGAAATGGPAPEVDRLLGLVRRADVPRLRKALTRDARRLGPRAFLGERVTPLLAALGRAWVDGTLAVRHEHLASEVLEDVLRSVRHALPPPRRRPLVLLTTLPDEHHGLGLQMAATFCAETGVKAHVLGVNTPLEEIVRAADDTGADAVGVSVSLATGGVRTDRALADLRRMLPPRVRLLVGGAGARGVRRGPRGVEYAETWAELERWLGGFEPRAG